MKVNIKTLFKLQECIRCPYSFKKYNKHMDLYCGWDLEKGIKSPKCRNIPSCGSFPDWVEKMKD